MKNSYRCPTCARTIINMESQFRGLDAEIEAQPLPIPYDRWRCLITCNDCSAKDNVPFHFLGLKCENCKSYNTSQIRILRPEDGVGNSRTTPAILPGPTRTRSANSITQPRSSPPRFARIEAGRTTGGERSLPEADRVITPADLAIEITVESELRHGNTDLLFDDGWETEDDGTEMISDNERTGVGCLGFKELKGGEDEDEDGEGYEADPVSLIGHP